MQIENIIEILKENFDCDESGLDWQEHKYIFENNTNNIYDIEVNGITVPFVSSFFLNDEELIISVDYINSSHVVISIIFT